MPNNPTEILRLLLENIAPIAVLILIFTFKPFILPKLYSIGFHTTLTFGIRIIKEDPKLFAEKYIHQDVANKDSIVRDFQKFQKAIKVKSVKSLSPNQEPQTKTYEAEIMTLDGVNHKYLFTVITDKKVINGAHSFQNKIRNIQQIA